MAFIAGAEYTLYLESSTNLDVRVGPCMSLSKYLVNWHVRALSLWPRVLYTHACQEREVRRNGAPNPGLKLRGYSAVSRWTSCSTVAV